MKSHKSFAFLIQGLFWLVIILNSLSYLNPSSPIGISWNHALWPIVAGQMVMFYLNSNWLLPKWFTIRRYRLYGVWLVLLLLAVSTISGHLVDQLLAAAPELWSNKSLFSGRAVIFTKRSLIDNTVILAASSAYTYFMIWRKNEEERAVLKEENLKSELSYLSVQLDPHFLFNTINTLYSLALKGEKANIHKGINQLIGFIDQMNTDDGQTLTNPGKELRKINNYIDLQKLRFSDEDEIEITLKDKLSRPEAPIPARVLIPLVENAFKHGISLSRPSFIHLEMKQQNDRFIFNISNTDYARINNEKGTGLGLKNIRKRLELMYKDRFELTSATDQGIFKVSLNLQTSDATQ